MQKQLKQVLEFHQIFHAVIGRKPSNNIPEKLRQNRIKLIREETDELIEAIEKKDIKDIAHEIADVLYVVLGTAISFGLHHSLEAVFDKIHKSNLTKIETSGKFKMSSDGSKVLKGKNYQKPKL